MSKIFMAIQCNNKDLKKKKNRSFSSFLWLMSLARDCYIPHDDDQDS